MLAVNLEFELGQPKNLKIFVAFVDPHAINQMISADHRRFLRPNCGLNVELPRKAFAIVELDAGADGVIVFEKAKRVKINSISGLASSLSFDRETDE